MDRWSCVVDQVLIFRCRYFFVEEGLKWQRSTKTWQRAAICCVLLWGQPWSRKMAWRTRRFNDLRDSPSPRCAERSRAAPYSWQHHNCFTVLFRVVRCNITTNNADIHHAGLSIPYEPSPIVWALACWSGIVGLRIGIYPTYHQVVALVQ